MASPELTADAAWASRYASWETVGNSGIGNFVLGAGYFIQDLVGGNAALAQTIVAVIVISFAATTLDTAARIQRFCLGELGTSVGVPALGNRYLGSLIAVIPAGLLAIFTEGPKGPGSGGFILWPIFGTTNQMIGAVTLILLFLYLRRAKRPTWPILIPMIFLLVMTTTAGVMNLVRELGQGTMNLPVVVFGFLFLLLEFLILIETVRVLRRPLAPPSSPGTSP